MNLIYLVSSLGGCFLNIFPSYLAVCFEPRGRKVYLIFLLGERFIYPLSVHGANGVMDNNYHLRSLLL